MSDTKLTPAEVERLALLSEELAETIVIVGKILRHGFDSFDPTDPEKIPNFVLLEREIADVKYAIRLMSINDDISRTAIHENYARISLENKRVYLHHQDLFPA